MPLPKEVLQPGITGGAEIAFRVLDDGSVVDARVVSTSHAEYGLAAKESVSSWKFPPIAERAASCSAELRCHFTFKTN